MTHATAPGPAMPAVDRRRRPAGPHRRLARFLAGRQPATYDPVAPSGWPTAGLVVEGTMCGAGIGFVIGGAVGVWIFVIGAIYGAPIGAVVGAAVGLPASIVLAVVLATAPKGRPATIHRRTAATLAVLLEALVVFLCGWTLLSDTGEDLRNRVLLAFPAIVVYGAITARLLRRATRYLADGWNERTGWKAVRP